MAGFECRDVVLDHTAEPHDFDRVRAQSRLMVIAQSDKKEEARQECDDDNANGGAGQELEMEMLWTKKPGDAASVKPSAYLCGGSGRVGLRHYKFQKAGILPLPLERGGRPSVGGSKAKSVPDADQK